MGEEVQLPVSIQIQALAVATTFPLHQTKCDKSSKTLNKFPGRTIQLLQLWLDIAIISSNQVLTILSFINILPPFTC